jgi:LEA14-like dessication related protein
MRLPRIPFTWATLACAALLLAACAGPGGKRRISEPAAGIQQLSVLADGRWEVTVRLDNFSNVPMQFATLDLRIALDGADAATVRAQPGIGIGPESADVVNVTVSPTAQARARIATALADGRGVDYRLEGEVRAGPEQADPRSYPIKRNSALSPVPGLPGVLR